MLTEVVVLPRDHRCLSTRRSIVCFGRLLTAYPHGLMVCGITRRIHLSKQTSLAKDRTDQFITIPPRKRARSRCRGFTRLTGPNLVVSPPFRIRAPRTQIFVLGTRAILFSLKARRISNAILRWIASLYLPRGFTMPRPKTRIRTRRCAACSSRSFSTSDSTASSSTGLQPSARSPSVLDVPNHSCRDQLRENALLKKYYCDVNIGDLIKFNEEIAHRLVTGPAEIIPLARPPALPKPRLSRADTLRSSRQP